MNIILTRKTPARLALSLLLSSLCLSISFAATKAQPNKAVSTTTTQQHMAKHAHKLMQRTTRFGNFALQLPKGFQGPTAIVEAPAHFYGFYRKDPKQKTNHAIIQFSSYDLDGKHDPYDNAINQNLSLTYFKQMLSVLRKRNIVFHHQAVENIIIDGITFKRTHWQARDAGGEVDGILYTAIHGNQVINITVQDRAPFAKASLPTMEASINSLQFNQDTVQ